MTDMLELEPAFRRHLGRYVTSTVTGPELAAYLADAVQALMFRWNRDYTVTQVATLTFEVSPDIAEKDIRPIILMASIIYKASSVALASYQDGDFSYNPLRGATNPIQLDRDELLLYLGSAVSLAPATSAPLRGFAFGLNPETYNWIMWGGWITDGVI